MSKCNLPDGYWIVFLSDTLTSNDIPYGVMSFIIDHPKNGGDVMV